MESSQDDLLKSWVSVQDTMGGAKRRAMRALVSEYMSLLKDPAEGFVVKVEDPFNWDVGIYGPPSTPYWGGYFKVAVSFPDEYPFEPPKLTFKSRFWHPNVYQNGVVCMSILHDPQTEDVPSGLPTEEKWNPTLSVRTVLLSLISIIGAPNPDSPANVDATKMYRAWVDGEDDTYIRVVTDIVNRSKKSADKDGIKIPQTLDEYLRKPREPEFLDLDDDSDSDASTASEPLSAPGSPSNGDVFFDTESMQTLSLAQKDVDPSASQMKEKETHDPTTCLERNVPVSSEQSMTQDGDTRSARDLGPADIQLPSEACTAAKKTTSTTAQNTTSTTAQNTTSATASVNQTQDLQVPTTSESTSLSTNSRKRRPPQPSRSSEKNENKKRKK